MKAPGPESAPAINPRDAVVGLGVSGKAEPATVAGVCLDSRMVRPGDLYVVLPGFHTHGAEPTTQAVGQGAVAVLTDPEGAWVVEDAGVPVLISHQLRPVMAEMSARVYGEPASGLELFGATRTNGKTTTVALLEAALVTIGRRVGTAGALGFRLDDRTLPSDRSTITAPDSPNLQALLALIRERGMHAVTIEVSSRVMTMSRADTLKFEVTAFLDLERDHPDFHRSMEEYFEAKVAPFTPGRTRVAVVQIDDEHGRQIADRTRRAGLPVATVGTCEEVNYHLAGYGPVLPLRGRAQLHTASGEVAVGLALPGWHDMVDAAIAVAVLERTGIPAGTTLPGLARAQVPGRMQVLPLPEEAPIVIMDFAHIPQAVVATLDAIREFGEVITVVGCGGDWGPDKRPLMGHATTGRSNILIITNDNPHTEDSARIRAAMLAGIEESRTRVIKTGGRGSAIELALATTGCDSVMAILEKGHEQG